jgi:hypothetical protein
VYAGGWFSSIGGQARNYIAALDATTGLATAWDPNASGGSGASIVFALAVSEPTVYAGGEFTSIGGQTRNYIAALDATTGLATAWDPNASGWVDVLEVSGSTVYAGGAFTDIGGQTRNNIAAVDATSGLATAWDPNPNSGGHVHALAVSGPTVYAGGSFTSMGNQPQSGIAAISVSTNDVPDPAGRKSVSLLQQNWPNPFTASTVIRFSLVTAEEVTLRVYDVAGREVTTLLRNEWLGPGEHQVEFSSSTLPTGIYICRLQAGDSVDSRRMVLIRE